MGIEGIKAKRYGTSRLSRVGGEVGAHKNLRVGDVWWGVYRAGPY